LFLVGLVIVIFVVFNYARSTWYPVYLTVVGRQTTADAMRHIKPKNEPILKKRFRRAGADYPPARIALVALKDERVLELWAKNKNNWVKIHAYPILGASGHPGPKLKEGDRQVPEGIYRIIGLNPNSEYHLSMQINYPNEYDLARAKEEKRANPGSDIFIHGRSSSVGCIAIGDQAIEEIFYITVITGLDKAKVIIAPNNLRVSRPVTDMDMAPSWSKVIYREVEKELKSMAH